MTSERDLPWQAQVVKLCTRLGLPTPQRPLFAEEAGENSRLPADEEPAEGSDSDAAFRRLVRAREQQLGQERGGRRKNLGSYYTPDCLIALLLDTTLEPLLDECCDAPDPEQALLALRLLDPACGAGDFLLAAARRLALRLLEIRGEAASAEGSDAAADERHLPAEQRSFWRRPECNAPRAALREVVAHCLCGIDEDPVAIGLTQLNLYLASASPGIAAELPAEHFICCNALLGWRCVDELLLPIRRDAYTAAPGDNPLVARRLRRRNGEESQAILSEAARRSETLRLHPERWADMADLTLAAWLLPKQSDIAVPTTGSVDACLRGAMPADAPELLAARDICRRFRIRHLFELFPGVPHDENGSPKFDCVIGNPPWNKLEINEREWFTGRCDSVAGTRGAARKTAIRRLSATQPELAEELERERRSVAVTSNYLRHVCAHRMPESSGISNLYVPFLHRYALCCRRGGRLGMIVPTGLMSDCGAQALFRRLHGGDYIRHFYDFENRRRLFPDVDQRQRFACISLGRAGKTARYAFFLKHPAELEQRERSLELSPKLFALLNPGTGGGVSFRCAADAAIAGRICSALPLLDADGDGGPWQIELRQGLYNMTTDSHRFYRRACAGTVPLIEGKMFHLYEPRFAGVNSRGLADESRPAQLADPGFRPGVRYHVVRAEAMARLPEAERRRGWLIAFRMVTSPTNERSFVCSPMPLGGYGNSVGLLLSAQPDARRLVCLAANLSSLVFDYLVRLKLSGLNLNFHIVRQLPVLPPEAYSDADVAYICGRIHRLLHNSRLMDVWARSCGFEGAPRPYDEDRRSRLRAELDAWFARRYGLSRDEFAYILDPALAPQLPGNRPGTATFAVLRSKEERLYGRYLSAELALAAWDALDASLGRPGGTPEP